MMPHQKLRLDTELCLFCCLEWLSGHFLVLFIVVSRPSIEVSQMFSYWSHQRQSMLPMLFWDSYDKQESTRLWLNGSFPDQLCPIFVLLLIDYSKGRALLIYIILLELVLAWEFVLKSLRSFRLSMSYLLLNLLIL